MQLARSTRILYKFFYVSCISWIWSYGRILFLALNSSFIFYCNSIQFHILCWITENLVGVFFQNAASLNFMIIRIWGSVFHWILVWKIKCFVLIFKPYRQNFHNLPPSCMINPRDFNMSPNYFNIVEISWHIWNYINQCIASWLTVLYPMCWSR